MAYAIAWTPTAQRDLRKVPEKVAHSTVEFIYGPVAESPQRVGKPLRLELAAPHSARRGDFRIIYRIDSGANRVDAYRSR